MTLCLLNFLITGSKRFVFVVLESQPLIKFVLLLLAAAQQSPAALFAATCADLDKTFPTRTWHHSIRKSWIAGTHSLAHGQAQFCS